MNEIAANDGLSCSISVAMPHWLGLKAEALYLAHRTSEALESIEEAIVAGRSGLRHCSAELRRLRGVFLAALGVEESQIEASFSEAIRIAKEQKSVSNEKQPTRTTAAKKRAGQEDLESDYLFWMF